MSVHEPDTQVVAPRGATSGPTRSAGQAGQAGATNSETSEPSEARRDEPGGVRQWVGRYELIHRIAHGGMATVYLGRSKGKAGFEKIVAVKLIHPHLASEPEFVGMFLDEARIAARIHHPHVVEILDLGDSDGAYYMVMEFIEGENLAALVRALAQHETKHETRQRLPVAVILQIVADTLEGLGAAHELRDIDGRPYELVHRDVSPHNILINLDGWAKVGDFGIMKAAGKASNTRTGELRGKLAYMAPEQARGGAVDPRTDLFALGVITWELLTGQRLFACTSEAATLEKVMACQVPRLAEVEGALEGLEHSPELRAGLQRLLDRALAADPELRPSDASTMLAEVKRLLRLVPRIKSEPSANAEPSAGPKADADEPRAYLARVMQRFFQRRVNYARAALRRTGEHDALGSGSGAVILEATRAVARPPTGSNSALNRTPTGPASDGAPGEFVTATGPGPLPDPFVHGPGSASHPQLVVQPSPLAQWTMWLLLPMLGAGIAITAMLLLGPSRGGFGTDAELEQGTGGELELPPLQAKPGPRSRAATDYQPVARTQTPPGEVRWYFSTTPAGAQILVDGEARGEPTPTWLYLPSSDELLDIRIELEGYEVRTLQLPAVHDQTFSEALEPLAPAASSSKPSKRVRKPSKATRPSKATQPSRTGEDSGASFFVPAPDSLREPKQK